MTACPRPRNGHPCKSRRCDYCGRLWAGDVRLKLFRNLDSYSGPVSLVSITAPGQDVLPWDESLCQHPGDESCSGKRGCQLVREHVQDWNRTAPKRWTRLNRRCAQAARRAFPRQLDLLAIVWEYQKRGALHVHIVVGLGSPVKMHAARHYVEELAGAAGQYGFGFVDRKMSSRPGQAAAAYLAAYFIEGEGRKASIRETVTADDVPSHVVYVARLLTSQTGVTMRTLRLRRVAYFRLQDGSWEITTAGLVDVDTGELRMLLTVFLRT